VYDAHNALIQQSPDEVDNLLTTAQHAASLGARVDLRDRAPVLTIRWSEHDSGTATDVDSLAAFLRVGNELPGGGRGETPSGAGADSSSDESPEPDGSLWDDPDRRQKWVADWVADPAHTQAVPSDQPWARYQRTHAGDLEVRLETDDPEDKIWADGLVVDPDNVVAVEAKYVTRPDSSMYEGNVPAFMLDRLFRDFDREMERYGNVARHQANPVDRIRIVTNTDAAARFLGERARGVIGPDVGLEVLVRREGGT
jgi:hypothetical protein